MSEEADLLDLSKPLELFMSLMGKKSIYSGRAHLSTNKAGIPVLHGSIAKKGAKHDKNSEFIYIDNKWIEADWDAKKGDWARKGGE